MQHPDSNLHSAHLTFVMQCIAADVPIPLCLDCHEIVETLTVAGDPIKLETFDEASE